MPISGYLAPRRLVVRARCRRNPDATIFLGNHADALLYYCSGTAAVAREVPGLISTPVPETLEV
jgi:hypothetical protein